MSHLLVTNDFPPKVGGIQTYLWELWRRLPPDETIVLTTAHPGAEQFDREQPFRVERIAGRVMLPTPDLVKRVRALVDETGATCVVLDPAVPAGLVGPRLGVPYALVLHGSESIGRVPGGAQMMGAVVRGAKHVIAAGNFPAAEARRVAGDAAPPITVIPPGIDLTRFAPVDRETRARTRARIGVARDAQLVVGISRLVPRKGFDTLIAASANIAHAFPRLRVAIGGTGRDAARLQRLIDTTNAPAQLLGRVSDDDLPGVYACADVFGMICRTRWGGIEPEGFGIVFLEAAACGVPQLAGDSGGAADAVEDGVTGLVVRDPSDVTATEAALTTLLTDEARRAAMGQRALERVRADFSYDHLAKQLEQTLAGVA